MKLRLYNLALLCLLYTSVTHSTENRTLFFSTKDIALGTGMMLLLTVAHEAGHAFANYLTRGELLAMNIGSQSSGNRKSYASLGKIRITGFNPSAAHVKMARKIGENKKVVAQSNIFISYTGPLVAIAAAWLSLYALNKYDLTEDYPAVKSVCFANLIGNIIQLLPFKILGTKSDGLHAYESYKKLQNIK